VRSSVDDEADRSPLITRDRCVVYGVGLLGMRASRKKDVDSRVVLSADNNSFKTS
jgi:hypothetical protein